MIEFYIFFALLIMSHLVRTLYEIIKDRKQITYVSNLTYLFLFINMSVLWVSWFHLCEIDRMKYDFGFFSYLALFLVVIGVFLFFYTIVKLRTFENYRGALVTNGLYSKIRHPMYLGFLFWIIGYPIYTGSLIMLLSSVVFIPNILYWQYLEEKSLKRKFPEYCEYIKKTWV